MGLGYVEGVTHDYVRHGTTTLFAALDIASGTVLTECKPRHRHQEFLGFLKRIDEAVPEDLTVHLIVDNYATHKHARCDYGWRNGLDFRFTTLRPTHHGSIRSSDGSVSSLSKRSVAAVSEASRIWSLESTTSSSTTTEDVAPSHGPRLPIPSSINLQGFVHEFQGQHTASQGQKLREQSKPAEITPGGLFPCEQMSIGCQAIAGYSKAATRQPFL